MIAEVSQITKINVCLLSVFWESPQAQHPVESAP